MTPEEWRVIGILIKQIAVMADNLDRPLERTLQAEKERLRQLGEWPPKEPLFDPRIDWQALRGRYLREVAELVSQTGDKPSPACKAESDLK